MHRKKHPTLLFENLATVFEQQKWGNQRHLFSLAQNWPEITGSEFACHSMPAWFRGKVLWVYVQDSIWMQQMQMAKPELLAAINTFLQGNLGMEDIRWTMMPRAAADIVAEGQRLPPLEVDPDRERSFRSMAENVRDSATREALCRLWRRFASINRGENSRS